MSKLLQSATLRQKLTWLTTVCSVAALATTAVALGAYEWFFYRRTTVSHLTTISSITARNSAAALAFANPDDAARTLKALDAEPAIGAAVLYGPNGDRVAAYQRPGTRFVIPLQPPPDGVEHTNSGVEITLPVVEVKRFGTLLMYADLSLLRARLGAYTFVLFGTTLVSALVAYLLTGWLSQRIVAPVQALVGAATGVKSKADYRIRVPKTDDDELGRLTDAFNAMLARIEENEGALYRGAERLRVVLDAAKIGTWEWDLGHDTFQWNERAHDIFAVPAGTAVTSDLFFGLIHPDDRPRVKAAIAAAASSSADFSVEFRLTQPERPPHYVVARGLFLKSTSAVVRSAPSAWRSISRSAGRRSCARRRARSVSAPWRSARRP